jgi:hypothetical protein
MSTRREFCKNLAFMGALASIPNMAFPSISIDKKKER